jgi:hypothetical protein
MEQLKEELRRVVVKPWRQSEERKSRLAERIAQAGRTGLMGAARPQNPAPLAAASVRGELRITATKWQTNENHNTKEPAELQL